MTKALYNLKVTTPAGENLVFHFTNDSKKFKAHFKAVEMGCTTDYFDTMHEAYSLDTSIEDIAESIEMFSR